MKYTSQYIPSCGNFGLFSISIGCGRFAAVGGDKMKKIRRYEVVEAIGCYPIREVGILGASGFVARTDGRSKADLQAAERLVAQANHAAELLGVLKLAGDLFSANHAISQFDWGKSALRAEDIRELNEVPLAIHAAIRKAEGRNSGGK